MSELSDGILGNLSEVSSSFGEGITDRDDKRYKTPSKTPDYEKREKKQKEKSKEYFKEKEKEGDQGND